MDRILISISREFGSGGRLIGKKLAAKLDIPCYDRTIIRKTAEKSGLSAEFIARAEERARSWFHFTGPLPGAGVPGITSSTPPVSHQAFFAQTEVIRELADEGSCVIVGRCSDYVLGDRPECLKVFIHADLPSRVERCRTQYELDEEGLEKRISRADRGRANYYSYYTGHAWGDMRRYDLTVNSTSTGIDGAVELIIAAAYLKEAQNAKEARG